jgi:hypothetical protein
VWSSSHLSAVTDVMVWVCLTRVYLALDVGDIFVRVFWLTYEESFHMIIFSFVHVTKSIVIRVAHFGFRDEVTYRWRITVFLNWRELKHLDITLSFSALSVLYSILFHNNLCSWGYLMLSSHAICSISCHYFFFMELYTGNFHVSRSCSMDLLRLNA